MDTWATLLKTAAAQDLVTFKLTVKNRRIRVDEDAKDQFAPVHKAPGCVVFMLPRASVER